MADMIADGLEVLDEWLTEFVSTEWTYRRGASGCTVSITEEQQRLRVTDRQGGTKVERLDFSGTFNASELDFGAGAVDPQPGDTVERSFGGTTRTFRLTPPNAGQEPCWHYCDPQKVRLRIFGKLCANV